MNKQFFDTHSRYERAMAEIKSMNLQPKWWQVVDRCCVEAIPTMEALADAFEGLAENLRPVHQPHDPAPNAINKVSGE